MSTLSDLKRSADIKYISRDFDSLIQNLKNYLKQQFPESYRDFSDTSGGMAFLELVAYVGDILNFYIDKQFNELFLDRAKERKNLISLAKNLGYTIRGKAAANVDLTVTTTYPVTGSGTANVEFILNKGTQVTSDDGVKFETVDDIDFSEDTDRIVTINGGTTTVSISGINTVNGETKVFNTFISTPKQFLKVTLPDTNVLEVISVTSSDGNIWYQADYLAQETQFFGLTNTDNASSSVPYVLSLRKIPRRFVIEKDENNYTSLVFGSGILTTEDSDFIPNPSDFVLPSTIRGVDDGFVIDSIDPENFLNTGTLGATPSNATLVITYRTGGGFETNVSSNSLRRFTNKKVSFITASSVSSLQKSQIEGSLQVNNPLAAYGGKDEETQREIREYAARNFAAQNRTITIQDYIVRTLTIPSKFGSPFRVQARRDPDSDFGVEIIVLIKDSNGNLALAPNQLKINIGNYLSKFKPLNDNLNIVDGKIINLQMNFGITTTNSMNSNLILANCLLRLKDYFRIDNWQMGQSISLTLLSSILQNVEGVVSVSNIFFKSLTGNVDGYTYSNNSFNVNGRTKNNLITVDADQMIEIRYSDIDIRGGILNQ